MLDFIDAVGLGHFLEDGGGIGLMKLEDPLLESRAGLMRLVHEARRRFWRSLEGVEEAIRWLGLVEDRGEIMEDTARFNRLLVGVLLKLNARFTCKSKQIFMKCK